MNDRHELESALRRKAGRTRMIYGVLALLSMILMIVFGILRETTSIKKDTPWGGMHEIEYIPAYNIALTVFFFIFVISSVFLFFAFIYGKVDTVEAGGSIITLYRGLSGAEVYVDGVRVERYGHYCEARLSDGSTVTVSFARNILWAHMSFSNGKSSIDL